ncbi:hypothetical protein [Caudoviricetes sp.]|nr:hypothetical protein [Caudoviricetes sp.]
MPDEGEGSAVAEQTAEGQSQQTEQTTQTEAEHATSGDTGRRDASGHMIPKSRLDEEISKRRGLEAQLAQYSKLGKLDDIQARLSRTEALAKGRKYTEQEIKEIREDFLNHVMPELQPLLRSQQERMSHFTDTVGPNHVRTFLTEVGIEATDENLADVSELLAGRIARDRDLLKLFAAQDPVVYKEAWKKVKGTLFGRRSAVPGVDRQRQALGTKLPGQGAQREPTRPKTDADKSDRELIEDAHNAALSRLSEQIAE